jgi:hypothetical protein
MEATKDASSNSAIANIAFPDGYQASDVSAEAEQRASKDENRDRDVDGQSLLIGPTMHRVTRFRL